MSVVAIAGAAGSAGPEVARTLGGRGHSLSLGGRNESRLATLAAELDGAGCMTYAVDLLDAEAARSWAAATRERLGPARALVHLVGGWRGGKPIAEAPPEDDAFLLDALVRTVQIATRAFLSDLAETGGRFVLVSSPQADHPSRTNAAYGAAKAAAEAWTLALGDELAERGGSAHIVRVSAIRDPVPVARAIADLVDGATSEARVAVDD